MRYLNCQPFFMKLGHLGVELVRYVRESRPTYLPHLATAVMAWSNWRKLSYSL